MSDRWDEYDDDDEFYEDDDDWGEDDDDVGPEFEQLYNAFNTDIIRLSQKLGRRLTASEKEAVVHRGLEQHVRGQDLDLPGALEEFYESTGAQRPNHDTPQGRGEYIKQRMAELEAPALDDERAFDLDNPTDRADYVRLRLRGEEFEDA